MFDTWFPRDWSTLKKLIWLRATALANRIKTVTGAIVTFVTSKAAPLINLTATLSPSQDLHGYDSPWPAGGGVNILNITDQYVYQAGGAKLHNSTYYGSNGVLNPPQGFSSTGRNSSYGPRIYVGYFEADVTLTASAVVSNGTLNASYTSTEPETGLSYTDVNGTKGTTSGRAYITFTTPTAGYYLIGAYANNTNDIDVTGFVLSVGSTVPTAWTPFANLCPISGHTGVTVYRTGANMIPTSVPSNVIAGTFATNSTTIYSATNARVFAIPVPKNTDIYVQKKNGNTDGHALALGDTGNIAVGTPVYNVFGFTNSGDKAYNTGEHTWLYVMSSTLALAEALFSTAEFMVSVGTARKDYVAPVQGNTYPITFPLLTPNIFDGEVEIGGISTSTGGNINQTDRIRSKNLTPVTAGETYYFYSSTPKAGSFYFYKSDKTFLSYGTKGTANAEFMPPENAAYVRFVLSGTTDLTYNIAVNYPSTVTTYEPYTNTVYSGTLSVNEDGTGQIVLTHTTLSVKDLDWAKSSTSGANGAYFTVTYSAPFLGWGNGGYTDALSNGLVKAGSNAAASNAPSNSFWWNNASSGLRIIYGATDGSATLTDLTTFLSDNNVVFYGKLATPVTIPLTASQINTLKGTNVVWVDDSDEISVTYRE